MNPDLALIERWLIGRSLARGLPLPFHQAGGLCVEVGNAVELRRHVFLDAGLALQACAKQIHVPRVYLKAAVDPGTLRSALPGHWRIEDIGYLMQGPTAMVANTELPQDYRITLEAEHGGYIARIMHVSDTTAAFGRIALRVGCAVFDQIVTDEAHRRLGLGTVVMKTLDSMAERARKTERLLVATKDGRALYEKLGWRVLSPWSTAVLP
ncbi:GNAT family N-acetyltransferase [Duganella sp. LX47W]|uniref:GNAT family N-acetyltransferase n=2 Tax=Rugamonas apoptosis TaxID=2758570 RepID=A0A7W2F7F0_9BURK|nr:GNAT family N-acetyltransferase [Rugamonas apoptosis]